MSPAQYKAKREQLGLTQVGLAALPLRPTKTNT